MGISDEPLGISCHLLSFLFQHRILTEARYAEIGLCSGIKVCQHTLVQNGIAENNGRNCTLGVDTSTRVNTLSKNRNGIRIAVRTVPGFHFDVSLASRGESRAANGSSER